MDDVDIKKGTIQVDMNVIAKNAVSLGQIMFSNDIIIIIVLKKDH